MKAMNFYTANGWAGSNYDSKLSTKEIAAKVRSYAKKNFPGFKFSVRSEWSMYTDSMYIELREGTCIPFVEGSRSAERGYMSTMSSVKAWKDELTPDVFKVLDAVTTYASSFRYNDSDAMQDYFDTNFYIHIKVSDEYKVIEPKAKKSGVKVENDSAIKFSIICEHELKKGVYMLFCPVVPVPPFFGSERACKNAQATFEKKLKEEFDKLPDERKKEVLEKLSYYIPEEKEGAANVVEPVTAEGLEIVDYSEKAIAVFGDTKAIKEQLKELGGRFNPSLNYNGEKRAGWIFSKKEADKVKELISPTELPALPEEIYIPELAEEPQGNDTPLIINDFAKYCYVDYPTKCKEMGGFKLGEVVYDQCGEIGIILAFYEGYEARLDSNGVTGVDNLKKCPKEIAEREIKHINIIRPEKSLTICTVEECQFENIHLTETDNFNNVRYYNIEGAGIITSAKVRADRKRYTVKDKPLTLGYYGILDNLDNCIIECYPTKEEAEKEAEILNIHFRHRHG